MDLFASICKWKPEKVELLNKFQSEYFSVISRWGAPECLTEMVSPAGQAFGKRYRSSHNEKENLMFCLRIIGIQAHSIFRLDSCRFHWDLQNRNSCNVVNLCKIDRLRGWSHCLLFSKVKVFVEVPILDLLVLGFGLCSTNSKSPWLRISLILFTHDLGLLDSPVQARNMASTWRPQLYLFQDSDQPVNSMW